MSEYNNNNNNNNNIMLLLILSKGLIYGTSIITYGYIHYYNNIII